MCIIGVLVGWSLLVPGFAFAQDKPSLNCRSTLYKGEFVCDSAVTRSYCSTTTLANEPRDKLVGVSSGLSFYKTSYCNLQQQDEDAIYGVVADQMSAYEPGWTKDVVKGVMANFSAVKLLELASENGGLSAMPPELVLNVVNNPNFDGQSAIYGRLRTAYDNERVMEKSRRSLKRQFQAREMWANGSLTDAPFDLIVDLNLVEIVLFGSQAKWMDDVYKFPQQGGSAGEAESGGASAETAGSTAQGGNEGDGGTSEGSGSGSAQPQDYKCVNPETGETVTEEPGAEISDDGSIPPGRVPANCGNGKMDPGEQCDDRNLKAGDGCSEACTNEPGSTLACMDPQAITFKPFVPKPAPPKVPGAPTGSGEAELEPTPTNPPPKEIPIDCPSGSVPAEGDKTVVQPASYLGPNILGVLKQFPESKKPACPNGMSEYSVTFNREAKDSAVTASASTGDGEALGITVAGNSFTVPRCIPTSACGDFEAARTLLFGENYKEDKDKAELAAAIEAFICVKVIKENRPESPYPVKEGCVDCHVLAMSDILGKLLEKNVACLETNAQAWGLSNRWGPGLSFNLSIVSMKGKNPLIRELGGGTPDTTTAEQTYKVSEKIQQDAKHMMDVNQEHLLGTLISDLPASEALNRTLEAKKGAEGNIREAMDFFTATSEGRVDQGSHEPIRQMLQEMFSRFTALQDLYVQLATGLKFKEKEACKF